MDGLSQSLSLLPGLSRYNERRLFFPDEWKPVDFEYCPFLPIDPTERTSEQINVIYEKRSPLSACFFGPDFYRKHIKRRITTGMKFYGDFGGFIFKHIVMKSTEIKETFPDMTLALPTQTTSFWKYRLESWRLGTSRCYFCLILWLFKLINKKKHKHF